MDQRAFEKLEKTVEDHLEKLQLERERFRELTKDFDPSDGPVDWRHTENIANRLHDLYMGAEHIFERIAKAVDGDKPSGEDWHKELLVRMARSNDERPAVIDADLRSRLGRYLRFRHFFRQGYGVETEWEKMTDLVEDYEETLTDTVDAVEQFLERTRPS